MEHDFGTYLKREREARGLSLAEVSRATKVKEGLLAALEASQLDELPAPVFLRGWVTAYARVVGTNESEALTRFRSWVDRVQPREPSQPLPTVMPASAPPLLQRMEPEEEGVDKRRVVMVVLLILVVATLTLSLLLQHGPHAGPGLSRGRDFVPPAGPPFSDHRPISV